jgi:hypothetical protein
MKRCQRFLIVFTVVAALLGCMHKNVAPPTAQQLGNKPSMSPLQGLSKSSRSVPVFGPPQEFVGSPPGEAGQRNVFDVHGPNLNRIALLKNGDESFAARVQLLEATKRGCISPKS